MSLDQEQFSVFWINTNIIEYRFLLSNKKRLFLKNGFVIILGINQSPLTFRLPFIYLFYGVRSSGLKAIHHMQANPYRTIHLYNRVFCIRYFFLIYRFIDVKCIISNLFRYIEFLCKHATYCMIAYIV